MKQKTKRFFSVLLAMLLLLSSLSVMSAAQTVDVCIINYPRAADTNKNGWGHPDLYLMGGWYMKASDKMVMRSIGDYNGPTCYCIEPGISQYTGDTLTQRGADYWDRHPGNSTIDRDTIQILIGRILQYGWTGNNSTDWLTTNPTAANELAMAKATQILIHEVIVGERRADFSKIDAHQYGYNNAIEQVTSACPIYAQIIENYNRIAAAVQQHMITPDFGGTVFDFAYNNGTYSVTLTDRNNVLGKYSFSSNSSGTSITQNGNQLTISTTNPTSESVQVIGKSVGVKKKAFVVWGDGVTSTSNNGQIQDMLQYGDTVEDPLKQLNLTIKVTTGNIKIVKTSEDGVIANVPLHISGNGVEKDVKTGADGTIAAEGLFAGTYTVTEKVDGFYVPQNAQTVTVLPGQTTTVTFNNTLKRGSLTVIKTAEDGLLAGHSFHLFGTSDSGLTVDTYAVTDSSGKAVFENVLIGSGYTLEEVDTGIQYVVPDSQTTSVAWNTVTNASFENTLKKFTVTVQKKDSATGAAQGDATLENAVYGIYDGDTLVDTYTTNSQGGFVSKEYICGDDWTLRELTPSEGYLLDEAVYHIGAEPGNFTVEHNPISTTVTEDVILGQIAIIKHNDDGSTQIETPEVGAEFEIYLKSAGTYAGANDRERDLLVTDGNGFALSKKLPYGVYTAHQTKGNEGTEFIPDFDVIINQNGEVYRYLINNATFESYLKIVKKDAETGKTVPLAGAGFQLYDHDGNLITMSYTYPTPTTIDTFYTDTNGMLVTPEQLRYGKGYKAVEVQAPYGMVLDSTPIYFDITPETMQDDGGITVVAISKSDFAQKGTIDITKLGEVFSSVVYDGTCYQPVFALVNNAGAEFKITAAEDITTPDGTVRAKKGTVVDTIKIGNSTTKSKPQYLGKYLVQETKAAPGMVLDNTVYEVTLTYAGQNVSVTSTAITITNARQKAVIDLWKVLEQDELFGLGMNGEIGNVQFALYAAEDLTAVDGSVIPKDGLLEILNLNEDGTAQFATDLPVGAKTYVKEYSTDAHYVLSDTIYPVVFEYAGQVTAEVHITVNNGEAIENNLIRGNIFGYKVDNDGFAVGNALMGLFRPDETLFTEENALMTYLSNEIGAFGFLDVPYGNYVVREIEAPEGFILNKTVYPVAITENEQVIEITVENRFITGNVQVIKADGVDNDMRLSGFTFEVYVDTDRNGDFDPNIDKFVDTLKEDEIGVYSLTGLRYNGYFLHEAAQDGKAYLLDDGYYYFEIREDGETVVVSNADNGLFLNMPVLGSLEITKTDVSDGKLLPNIGFRIRNEKGEIIREGYTDENGVVRFDHLRYGKYTYQEFSADGYILDSKEYPFEIAENGQVITVTMTNEPIPVEIPKTGGKAVWVTATGVTVLVSAAWLTLATKKRRRKA